jgi:hypothetical protein
VIFVSLAPACGVGDGSPVPLVGNSGSGMSSSGSAGSGAASGAAASGTAASGAGMSGAASSGTGPMMSFKTDIMPIFQTSCAKPINCHNDPTTAVKNAPGGGRPYLGTAIDGGAETTADIMKVYLGLTSDTPPNHSTSWELLKPTPMKYIAPGDPTKSYLMIKMDNMQGQPMYDCSTGDFATICGLLMPSDSTTGPLDPATRDKVRNWISQGANPN